MRSVLAGITFLFAANLCAATTAHAACFEDLGQTGCTNRETFPRSDLRRLSCQSLWLVRNTIYDENGFCFKTSAAQAQFDNSDCTVKNAANVKLNSHERANISRIRQVEREKGCKP